MDSILGASGPLFQRPGATFVACRFPMFFGWFPGPVKISSRGELGEVEGDLRYFWALLIGNIQTTRQQTTDQTDSRTADLQLQTDQQKTGDK